MKFIYTSWWNWTCFAIGFSATILNLCFLSMGHNWPLSTLGVAIGLLGMLSSLECRAACAVAAEIGRRL